MARPDPSAEKPPVLGDLDVQDGPARLARLHALTTRLSQTLELPETAQILVDEGTEALQAFSAAIWQISPDGGALEMLRSHGDEEKAARWKTIPLETDAPLTAAVKSGQSVWIESRADYALRFPASEVRTREVTTPDLAVACLPLSSNGRTVGGLVITFDRARRFDEDDRRFLEILADHAAQAFERSKHYRQEKEARRAAEATRAENALLYRLTDLANRAATPEEIYGVALDGLILALNLERAAILLFDPEGVMRFKAWRGLSETYRRAVEGHSPWKPTDVGAEPILLPDVARDPSVACYLPTFQAEGIASLGFVPLVSGGRVLGKFVVYRAAPHEFSEAEVRMAQAIADQIASAVDRQQVRDERERLIEELSRTVRFNETFVGVLGHDLRNPLAAILAAAQLGLHVNENEALESPLHRILDSGERMNRMIIQLLDFTRIRVGEGLGTHRAETDLLELFQHAREELENSHPDRTIEISSEGALLGAWDPDRLAQVASNLIGNALEHGTPESGVRLRLDGTAPDQIRIEIENDGSIPPDLLPVLFEPFRGGNPHKQPRGLGLGLYITHQIVLAHEGTIDVASSESTGTTFTILLPRTHGAVIGPPRSRSTPPSGHRAARFRR